MAAELTLLPYPDGWFAIAFSRDLHKQRILRTKIAGKEIVLYRTRTGTAYAIDPYCPHLGAHLGVGASIKGEEIVCPFHQFAFAPTGVCVRGFDGGPPPKASLQHHAVEEMNGVIFIWQSSAGVGPTWRIPSRPAVHGRYASRHTVTISGHPQDVIENAIDLGHISPVHHYTISVARSPMKTDGHILTIGPTVRRKLPGLGTAEVNFELEAHGLGYEYVSAYIPELRIHVIVQMMTTLEGPRDLSVRFSVQAWVGSGIGSGLGNRLIARALTYIVGKVFWRDIRLDFPIWENKTYAAKPRLTAGDGPIQQYRRWASQFYDSSHDAVRVGTSVIISPIDTQVPS